MFAMASISFGSATLAIKQKNSVLILRKQQFFGSSDFHGSSRRLFSTLIMLSYLA